MHRMISRLVSFPFLTRGSRNLRRMQVLQDLDNNHLPLEVPLAIKRDKYTMRLEVPAQYGTDTTGHS